MYKTGRSRLDARHIAWLAVEAAVCRHSTVHGGACDDIMTRDVIRPSTNQRGVQRASSPGVPHRQPPCRQYQMFRVVYVPYAQLHYCPRTDPLGPLCLTRKNIEKNTHALLDERVCVASVVICNPQHSFDCHAIGIHVGVGVDKQFRLPRRPYIL